uniref:Putative tail fiber protein n=1 Tax=viral metagenome TaxID=1070528 RepID=A0A6M3JXW8_9ZZZZ
MECIENIKLSGEIQFLGKHKDGTIFCDRTIKNTITTVGKALFAALMVVDVGGTGCDYIALGVGTPSATALGSESTTDGGARRGGANLTGTVVTTTLTEDTAQFVTTFTFTGSLALTEAGLFNAASTGIMVASQTFSAVNVIDTDTLQITWKIKVA